MAGLSCHSQASTYTLQEAVAQAQARDPWILGSRHRQASLEAQSVAAGSLPDPVVSLGLANLPSDNFDFAREPMTQFKVALSQRFPRGATRALQQQRLATLSQIQPHARRARRAAVALTVAQVWLDIYRNQWTIHLIEEDRGLFEYLVDLTQANYTTTAGATRQQDLIRAELELTRLDDRLTQLRLRRDSLSAKLGEWLDDPAVRVLSPAQAASERAFFTAQGMPVPFAHAPNHAPHHPGEKNAQLSQILGGHPAIQSIDWKIRGFKTTVDLAKQAYKPQWGVNASYGYRDDSPQGAPRADFFSAAVTFDLPLFTAKRQDKNLQSAQAEFEAIKTERSLALRQLKSGYESAEARYFRLLERQTLFDTLLLKKMSQQAEASLSAYTHDTGNFSEVVRARIAELNARIEAVNVAMDLQKTIAELHYFQTGTPPSASIDGPSIDGLASPGETQ